MNNKDNAQEGATDPGLLKWFANWRVVAQFFFGGWLQLLAVYFAVESDTLRSWSWIVFLLPILVPVMWIPGYMGEYDRATRSWRHARLVGSDQLFAIGRLLLSRGVSSVLFYIGGWGYTRHWWVTFFLYPLGVMLMALGWPGKKWKDADDAKKENKEYTPRGFIAAFIAEQRYVGRLLIRDAIITPLAVLFYVGPNERMLWMGVFVVLAPSLWLVGWHFDKQKTDLKPGTTKKDALLLGVGECGRQLFAGACSLLCVMGGQKSVWKFASFPAMLIALLFLWVGYSVRARQSNASKSFTGFGRDFVEKHGDQFVYLLLYYSLMTPFRFLTGLRPGPVTSIVDQRGLSALVLLPLAFVIFAMVQYGRSLKKDVGSKA